jgi:hypothetical protein
MSEDFVSKYIKMGKSAEEVALTSTKLCWRYFHHLFTGLVDEFGFEKGYELYYASMKPWAENGFREAIRKLGYTQEDLRDFRKLAKVLEAGYMSTFALDYEFVELTDDKIVIAVKFCPNFLWGTRWGLISDVGADPYPQSCRYYMMESLMSTVQDLRTLAEIAGLLGDVEVRLDKVMCLGDNACHYVIERNDLSKRQMGRY